jgi:hypothetical protein
MKQYLSIIILFLIEFVEKIQYRNLKRDENDPLSKFLDILPVNDISIKGKNGWVPIMVLFV